MHSIDAKHGLMGKIKIIGFRNVVLNLVHEKISLYAIIKRHHNRLIRHTLRHEGLAGTILEGLVEGRKRKERQGLEYVK